MVIVVLTVQMALKVWKEGLLEPLHRHLVAALLEEIRRCVCREGRKGRLE